MSAPHRTSIRVYYEDTDFSGFVYHANYLRFLERGRTEFLRAHGVSQSTLLEEAGLVFVVGRLSIDFLRPARMDDLLVVETALSKARGAVLLLNQQARRADNVLARASVTIVAVRDGKPARLPPRLRDMMMVADTGA